MAIKSPSSTIRGDPRLVPPKEKAKPKCDTKATDKSKTANGPMEKAESKSTGGASIAIYPEQMASGKGTLICGNLLNQNPNAAYCKLFNLGAFQGCRHFRSP